MKKRRGQQGRRKGNQAVPKIKFIMIDGVAISTPMLNFLRHIQSNHTDFIEMADALVDVMNVIAEEPDLVPELDDHHHASLNYLYDFLLRIWYDAHQ